MSRSQVEGGNRTNKLSASPDLVNETERQRLAAAFWEIYYRNKKMYRQVLRDHVYDILFALMERPDLMQSPGDRFYVLREMIFFTSDSNEPNPTEIWVPVKTNAEFEKRLQLLKQELQTNPENLERQEQRLAAELDRYHLVEEQMLSTVKGFPDDSDVKQSVLRYLNDLNDLKTNLLLSQAELQQKLSENQEQVVKKYELAKEIGDALLNEIKQRSPTRRAEELAEKIGSLLSRLSGIRKKNST